MGDLPFLIHQCDGPITRAKTIGSTYYQWRTCTECGVESGASVFNLAAVQKVDLSKVPAYKPYNPPKPMVSLSEQKRMALLCKAISVTQDPADKKQLRDDLAYLENKYRGQLLEEDPNG